MALQKKGSKNSTSAPKELDPTSKLAAVRTAMVNDDWETAIKLAARFPMLGAQASAIQRARDALNNPGLYLELGHDLDRLHKEAVAALKERFSKSWAVAQKNKTTK